MSCDLCHVHVADTADHRFFHVWSFLQSSRVGMGHGALENAGFLQLIVVFTV